MKILKNTLANDSFVMVNKHLIKLVGLDASALLGDLYSKEKYFEARGELINKSFFNTRENIQNDLGLTAHQQRKAEEKLINAGLIKIESKAQIVNGKTIARYVNYYTLNHQNILDVMSKDINTDELKSLTRTNKKITLKQEPVNNNKIIKIKKQKSDNKSITLETLEPRYINDTEYYISSFNNRKQITIGNLIKLKLLCTSYSEITIQQIDKCKDDFQLYPLYNIIQHEIKTLTREFNLVIDKQYTSLV